MSNDILITYAATMRCPRITSMEHTKLFENKQDLINIYRHYYILQTYIHEWVSNPQLMSSHSGTNNIKVQKYAC